MDQESRFLNSNSSSNLMAGIHTFYISKIYHSTLTVLSSRSAPKMYDSIRKLIIKMHIMTLTLL